MQMVITTASFSKVEEAEWPEPREENSEEHGENDREGEPGAADNA
jgi:hypothetical protein